MASPPQIKPEDLIAPIEGENPAGNPRDYLVEQQLDKSRKEQDVEEKGERKKVPPDWKGIVTTTTEQLKNHSKDLDWAVRLVEALTKQHGYAGLRDGFQFLRLMTDQCWDRMYPVPDTEEGEDMTIRGDKLGDSLSDPDYGMMFPLTVLAIPIVTIDNEPYSLLDKQKAEKGKAEISSESFNRGQPLDANLFEDVKQCVEEFKQFRETLDQKLEGKGPSFSKLAEVLEEAQFYLRNLVGEEEEAEEEPSVEESANGDAGAAAPKKSGVAEAITSREQAYKQLSHIAGVLEKLEPHSPIPDLIRRTVELGKMPFRKLIREIVREDKMIKEIYREYGIQEEPPE